MYQELRPDEQKLSKYKKGMKKADKSYCRKCVHWSTGYGIVNECCTYLLDTHKRRGCPVGYCDKFSTDKNDILYDWRTEDLYNYREKFDKGDIEVPVYANSTINLLNEDI